MGRFGLRDFGQTISLRAAREYLVQRGWRIREDGVRLVCEGPNDDDGRPILQILPADESYADYPLRLEDLISTLSALEARPAIAIAADMALCEEPAPSRTGSLAEDLAAELSRSRIEIAPGKEREEAIGKLRALLAGGELKTGQHYSIYDFEPTQQAALLAAHFVRLVVVNRASQMLLWRLCHRVMAEVGLTLQLLPDEVEELWTLAASDDPDAPQNVAEWVAEHARRVPGKRKTNEEPWLRETRPPVE